MSGCKVTDILMPRCVGDMYRKPDRDRNVSPEYGDSLYFPKITAASGAK
jgi:hypothetical protein